MKATVHIDGLIDLDRALGQLPRATAKNVLRRVLLQAAQPIADDYRAHVDVKSGDLQKTIGVGTKLTKRQARLQRRQDERSYVEVYAGAGDDPAAHLEEFGSIHNTPNGALRASWDTNQGRALETIKTELGTEIAKAADRVARKRTRAAAQGG